jgi:RNA polymerase sigma-70 factor (ECF subfamily)
VTFTDPTWLEEERRCLGAIRRGDQEAFRRLYDVLAPPLYARILLPRVGDAQAAEDLLGETFARAIERLDRYEDRGGSIWSWLVTIARNLTQDLHRARAREGRGRLSFEALLAPLVGGEGDLGDARLDGARLGEAVASTLARLNPRYRRALELRFLEERERAECAALLEVKLGTFDVLLLRALRAFRAEWLDSNDRQEPAR